MIPRRLRPQAALSAAGLALALLSASGPATGQAGVAGRVTNAPSAAERYWVTLRDKTGVQFDPQRDFSPEARARRRR
ncbi:hypothetical protein, partial [Hymenobacter agri]